MKCSVFLREMLMQRPPFFNSRVPKKPIMSWHDCNKRLQAWENNPSYEALKRSMVVEQKFQWSIFTPCGRSATLEGVTTTVCFQKYLIHKGLMFMFCRENAILLKVLQVHYDTIIRFWNKSMPTISKFKT